jgi:hypothetical protein
MLTQQSNMAGNQKNVSFQVRKFLRVKVYRIARLLVIGGLRAKTSFQFGEFLSPALLGSLPFWQTSGLGMRYDPLPASMVSRRRRLRFVYFDGGAASVLTLGEVRELAEA